MKALEVRRWPLQIWRRRSARERAGKAAVVGTLGAMITGWCLPLVAVGLLGATALGAGLVYMLGRFGPTGRAARQLTDDAVPVDPATCVRALVMVHARAPASIAWPLAGMSFLVPFLLHFLVVLLVTGPADAFSFGTLSGFGAYVSVAAMMLIPAYATLLIQCYRHALRVTESSPGAADPSAGVKALGFTALAALVPGILLAGIPSFVVAATGVLFVPAMFWWADNMHGKERTALATIEDELAKDAPDAVFETCRDLVLSTAVDASGRAMALRMLLRHYPPARIKPIIDALLSLDAGDLTLYVLDACRAINHRPSVGHLTRIARHPRPDLACAAVKLLVASHGEAAEPALVKLLGVSSEDVRSAVLAGLGRVGTRDSVVAIRRAMGLEMGNYYPTAAARRAIRRIQRRMPSAEPGALSVAAPSTGELSLAAEARDGGDLSLVRRD